MKEVFKPNIEDEHQEGCIFKESFQKKEEKKMGQGEKNTIPKLL